MRNVLVIGGAGYIGSHIVYSLKDKGYKVVVFDNFSTGHIESIPKDVPYINGDLGNKEMVARALIEHKIDIVLHFAAFIEVGESVIVPSKYYINNFAKVINLLDTLIENKVYNFLFSSTAAVFGNPLTNSIDENHTKLPINPYGKTKFFVEEILKDYNKAYKLNYTIFRYFNAGGASMVYPIGESHSPESHLIPIILQVANGKRDSIKVYGTDYPTKDGTCIRDFIHVDDLTRAHILGMERMINNNISDDFNLGSGDGYSVMEVINRAKKITGVDFKVELGDRREGDSPILVADSKKAKDILNWQTELSLDTIIESAWNWEKNRKY